MPVMKVFSCSKSSSNSLLEPSTRKAKSIILLHEYSLGGSSMSSSGAGVVGVRISSTGSQDTQDKFFP